MAKEEAEFLTSIKANIPKPNPDSIHLRLDIADDLIGIAGFTEIAWINRNAKTYYFSGSTENLLMLVTLEGIKYCSTPSHEMCV